jgi:hypothetical protein
MYNTRLGEDLLQEYVAKIGIQLTLRLLIHLTLSVKDGAERLKREKQSYREELLKRSDLLDTHDCTHRPYSYSLHGSKKGNNDEQYFFAVYRTRYWNLTRKRLPFF